MHLKGRVAAAYYRALGMDVLGPYTLMVSNHKLTRHAIEAQQREMLDSILALACQRVPYFHRLGLAPEIGAFPVMRKEFLDKHFAELQVKGASTARAKVASGSGTSSISTRMLIDKSSYAWHFAGRWRGNQILGYEPGVRSMLMAQHRLPSPWKRIKSQLGELFTNRFLVAVIAQDEAATRAIHRRMHMLQPVVLDAMTSTLEAYVRWCKQLSLHPPRSIKLVRPSGENVSADHRQLFSEFFNIPVRSSYGAREFGSCAGECEAGQYHLWPEACYYEVIREDGSIGTTGTGRILITTLHNEVMPLIRYDPGDIVTISGETCPCGLPLPVMSSIEGRTSELLYRPDGKTVSSQALHQLIYYLNQADWRVTQDGSDHLDIQIVPATDWGEADADKLRRGIEHFGGGQFKFDLRLVQSIPLLPNGKGPKVINTTDTRY